eukprot:8926974-Pyramimonas_sp.AAC.2
MSVSWDRRSVPWGRMRVLRSWLAAGCWLQGFSGTKQDTVVEKSMEQLMRGGPADDARGPFALGP